jgi:hypothetical protein
MKPFSMPTASLRTLATGARQFVVHGRVRDHHVIPGELVVVHPIDHGQIRAVRGRRDDDALGAGLEVRGGLLLRGEDAGAFHRDVDAEIPMRQLGRVLDGRDPDLLAVDHERVAVDLDLARVAAVDGIEPEQVSVRLHRAEIVDRDDLNVGPARLVDGAQHVAADATEPVDGDLDAHVTELPRALSDDVAARCCGFLQIMGAQHPLRHGLGRDSEVTVKVLVGRARAEPAHSDKDAVRPDDAVPAEPDPRLDRDPDGRIAMTSLRTWRAERGTGRARAPRQRYGKACHGIFLRRERDLDLERGEDRARACPGGDSS